MTTMGGTRCLKAILPLVPCRSRFKQRLGDKLLLVPDGNVDVGGWLGESTAGCTLCRRFDNDNIILARVIFIACNDYIRTIRVYYG